EYFGRGRRARLHRQGLRQLPPRQSRAGRPAAKHDPYRHRGRYVEPRPAHDAESAAVLPRRNASAPQLPVDAPVRVSRRRYRARKTRLHRAQVRRLPRGRNTWRASTAGTGAQVFRGQHHFRAVASRPADAQPHEAGRHRMAAIPQLAGSREPDRILELGAVIAEARSLTVAPLCQAYVRWWYTPHTNMCLYTTNEHRPAKEARP